jgi:tetratricopeptide (TPR) repeat protein
MVLAIAGGVSGCATSRPPALDPKIKQLSESASASYLRGEVDRAGVLYQQALQRARLIDARDDIARNAYNLALCRLAEGNLIEARGLLNQAEGLAHRQGHSAEHSRILLAQAEVARLSGDASLSLKLAREAFPETVDREGRSQSFLLQGEAEISAGRTREALLLYTSARSSVTDRTPAMLCARLDELEVRLIQAQALTGHEAGRQVSRANWLKKAGQFKLMVSALESAAECYEKESKWEDAFSCRIRAAQSLLSDGKRDRAADMLRRAADLAARTGREKDKVLVAELMREVK